MPKVFKDKAGNPLETGLYNISVLEWPLAFQKYAPTYWGNFKSQEEAIFQDYKGRLYHLSTAQVSTLATQTTPKDLKEYISAAKFLIREAEEEFLQIMLDAQTLPKCTPTQEQNQEENDALLGELFGI